MTIILLVLLTAVLAVMYPTPVVRMLSSKVLAVPQSGVQVRAYPLVLRWLLFGRIATTFSASTICVVESAWASWTEDQRRLILKHELAHVAQARKLGPLYLPKYVALFVRYGYTNHPMEIEANKAELS